MATPWGVELDEVEPLLDERLKCLFRQFCHLFHLLFRWWRYLTFCLGLWAQKEGNDNWDNTGENGDNTGENEDNTGENEDNTGENGDNTGENEDNRGENGYNRGEFDVKVFTYSEAFSPYKMDSCTDEHERLCRSIWYS